MRITFLSLSLLLIGACNSGPPPCPTCAQAKLANKWCDACNVGYVAGVPIRNKMLFEALDAHGHVLVLSAVKCPTCQAAIRADGYCEKCRIGWVHKLAYFSRLTYHLAKGKSCDPSTLTCEVCRKNAENYGWCPSCGVGMIGNFAVPTRADFEGGVRGFELMLAANEASKRCQECSLAIMADASCFYCKITYKDGKPVPPKPTDGSDAEHRSR
jgi:hypothetical protein